MANKVRRLCIIGIIIFYAVFCVFIIQYFNISDVSIILSILGIAIALLIATSQGFVIRELKSIGMETRETAEALRVDSFTRSRANRFFQLSAGSKERYKLIFPHQFKDRPLPSINAGDYYALLVIDRKLGPENIVLHGLDKEDEISNNLLSGRVILICAHIANPAVKQLFTIHNIKSAQDLEDLPNTDIPCWFVNDERKSVKRSDDERKEAIRKIRVSINGTHQLIESPSEGSYIDAAKLGGKECKIDGIQEDYGILARIRIDNNIYIIVAGIHQYGTWIVAEFLDGLLSREECQYSSVFLGDSDFIGVIWGEFNTEKIKVAEVKVHHHYLWQKKGCEWIRCSSKEKA